MTAEVREGAKTKRLVIALTGPMAAGKNAAAFILAEAGCAVIDADKTAHAALEKVKTPVLAQFESRARAQKLELVNTDGSVNRRNLAKIAFASAENLARLERILYPETTRLINEFIAANGDKNVVVNAVALHKTPELLARCDFLIYVDACPLIRFLRVWRRDRHNPVHILKRFYAQKQLYTQYLQKNVDIYKVSNNKTIAHLKHELENLLASKGLRG